MNNKLNKSFFLSLFILVIFVLGIKNSQSFAIENEEEPFCIVESQNNLKVDITEDIVTIGGMLHFVIPGDDRQTAFYCEYPHNLVFQGGGFKGLAYLGALRELETKGILDRIERVAGASAGAITATLIALDYNAEEAKSIILNNPLDNLLDYELENKYKKIISCLINLIKTNEHLFGEFKFENIEQYIPSGILTHANKSTDCSKFKLEEFSKKETAKALVKAWWEDWGTKGLNLLHLYNMINEIGGLHEGDKLRDWIDELIEGKIGIKNCTFGELKEKINNGEQFKHLHIRATKIGNEKKIVEFSSEDSKCDNIIISDAVTASSSFPFVFKPRKLRYKYDDEEISTEREEFIDGGVLSNFPLEVFDKDCTPDKKTLGLSLYSTEDATLDEKSSLWEVLKDVVNIYLNAESNIREFANYNNQNRQLYSERTIKINDMGVGTFEPNIVPEKQQKLIDSGAHATRVFFSEENQYLSKLCYEKEKKSYLPNVHPHFTKRDKPDQELTRQLIDPILSWNPGQVTKMVVLSGLGGSGKTELATYFANQNKDHFAFVYWIDSSKGELVDKAHKNLAKAFDIKLSGLESSKTIQKALFSHLEKYNDGSNKPWLLIYDGVGTKREIENMEFPKSGGYILITARNADLFKGPVEIIENLEKFSEDEAEECLKKIIGHKTKKEDRKALIKTVGRFPFVIEFAAAYIANEKMTVEEYIDKLKEESCFIIDMIDTGNPRYDQSLRESWEITFKTIQSKHPKAFKLLQLCSYFHHKSIPIDWIQEENLEVLKTYHLIRQNDAHTFSLHDLIHEVIRKNREIYKGHDENSVERIFQAAVKVILQKGKYFDRTNPNTWKKSTKWLFHAIEFLNYSNDKHLKVDLKTIGDIYFLVAAITVHTLGDYKKGSYYHEKALEKRKNLYKKKEHIDVAISYNRLGLANMSCVNYEKALKNFKESIRIFDTIYKNTNEHHEEEPLVLSNMGVLQSCLGNCERALANGQKALRIAQEIYGTRPHPDKGYAFICQGIGELRLNRLSEAEESAKNANKIYQNIKATTGKLNPDAVFASHILGISYYMKGYYEQAKKEFNKALTTSSEIYEEGISSFEKSYSLNNLGAVAYKQKKYEEALTFFEKSLEESKEIYGGELYLDVIYALDNVIAVLCKLDRFDEAIAKTQEKVRIINAIKENKNNSPDFHFSILNIGAPLYIFDSHYELLNCAQPLEKKPNTFLQEILNRNDKALIDIQEIYEKKREHPCIAFVKINLGITAYQLTEHTKAAIEFNQAIKILKKLSKNRPYYDFNLALVLNNLGVTQNARSCDKEALELLNDSLKKYIAAFNNTPHPIINQVAANENTVKNSKDRWRCVNWLWKDCSVNE